MLLISQVLLFHHDNDYAYRRRRVVGDHGRRIWVTTQGETKLEALLMLAASDAGKIGEIGY